LKANLEAAPEVSQFTSNAGAKKAGTLNNAAYKWQGMKIRYTTYNYNNKTTEPLFEDACCWQMLSCWRGMLKNEEMFFPAIIAVNTPTATAQLQSRNEAEKASRPTTK
jgi:hypothetical protein